MTTPSPTTSAERPQIAGEKDSATDSDGHEHPADTSTTDDAQPETTSCDEELETQAEPAPLQQSSTRWLRPLAFGVLPAAALLLCLGAVFLKWQDSTVRAAAPSAESIQAAKDSTAAILSYRADTVDKDLNGARDRLTGTFLNAYTSLINEVVIPGAKQKQISSTATVKAAASVSATENRSVVLVFVNQIVTVGNGPPTETASSVRVTLDKVQNRWLISQFDPV